MHLKNLLAFLLIIVSMSLSAQTQTWQWVKAGGSNSDNGPLLAAECKIGGCDAEGNVYAVGMINGPNPVFDTFNGAHVSFTNFQGQSYLLFSYDCSGHMRWAKQIGSDEGLYANYGVTTDPQGNTYLASKFWYGMNGGSVNLFLGDTVLAPTNVLTQPYFCMIKYDSLGRLVWFKNFEEDTAYTSHTGKSGAYGLRIGSSGNLWMASIIDSNYAIAPNLHTTKQGKYNVEIDPLTGNILGGYYISNQNYGDGYLPDISYDIDENENYYETGTLQLTVSGQVNGDTLILANRRVAVDTNYFTADESFIFSLDKSGNLRFLIMQDTVKNNAFFQLTACKFDMVHDQLMIACNLGDSGVRIQGSSFGFSRQNFGPHPFNTLGAYCIDANGNQKWCKYMTSANGFIGLMFQDVPQPDYMVGLNPGGTEIFNNADTLIVGNSVCTTNCSYYYKLVTAFDGNGNITSKYIADLGDINTNGVSGDQTPYGATDWRGNVYLGGSITSYMATPADSVVNTDAQSGNFFIAKIGISDCSCPTPGVQYTQTVHGDTVYFYGSSVNHSDSIRWRLGDGGISLSDTFFHVYTNHDSTYTVTAIAYSACGVDSITKLITVTSVGIKMIESTQTAVYPNPAKNSVNLDVSGPATIGLVYANGSSVWNSPMQINQQGTYVFDMSKYSCAMYYFIVQYTNGKTDVMQVVKE